MKTAEYNLPFGVNPALEPVQTGTTPEGTDKKGNKTGGKPVYAYKTIKTREAETLAEFGSELVDPESPEDTVLGLAQGALDIIVQRVVREWAQGQECSDMIEGKTADTKDLSDEERVDFALAYAQDLADTYRHGRKRVVTGGQKAAANKALAQTNALAEAAKTNPAIAALLAEQQKVLAELGF